MNKIAIIAASLVAILCATTASALTPAPASQPTTAAAASDSVATVVRIKSLKEKARILKEQISAADSKRNAHIDGVSAANLELINDRQDSICLDLRSQLVAVELELQELTPSITPQAAQQIATIVQQQQQPQQQQPQTQPGGAATKRD